MKIWIGAAALMLLTLAVTATAAIAADIAVCTLSADKKTVTVTANNPYAQEMACEVNCDMAIPNGIATVVCAKPVPVGAKDFVMCAKSGGPYTRVKGAEVNCPDPTAKPAAIDKKPTDDDASAKDDDDDDKDADEMVDKLEKQQQQLMNRLHQK